MEKRGFEHEALFYADEGDFLAGALPFIRDAVAADDPGVAGAVCPGWLAWGV